MPAKQNWQIGVGARRTKPLQAREYAMNRAIVTRAKPLGFAVLAVTLGLLSGCDEALLSSGASPDGDTSASDNDGKIELLPQVASGSQRDVEAPDVFEVTEAGLWDGRPSLGGIWVAHPDAAQPERVVIKNKSNNKSVTGALFRRERDLPGPALQVSSAAAEKLGLLAGAPTSIYVVALRRETVEEAPAETDEAPAEAASEDQAVADATEASEETKEVSETAETKSEKPAKRKWWQKKAPAAAATAGAAAAVATAETGSDVTAEATESTADASVQAASTPGLSDAPVQAPTEKPAKRKWWQKKDPDEITQTPLDPIAGAEAAIDAAEPTPVAATTGTAKVSSLTKPYIQIGTYSVEKNANSAAEKIRRNGMAAEVRELKTAENTVWRVLVGPAMTRSERKALLGDVRDLGFTDAFTTSN
nr:SPOR domain-containing protein [uncultured Ruegeria sp.]